MTRINVSVSDKMKDWLGEQPQRNVSRLLQKPLQQEMAKESGRHGNEVSMAGNKIASNDHFECGEVFSYYLDEEDLESPRCGRNHSGENHG
jgi:hypothetical protein